MQFVVVREIFLAAIASVEKAAPRHGARVIMSHIRILASDGQIELVANDSEMQLSARFACEQIEQEGMAAFPATLLSSMIKSLPQGALISIKVVGQKANILCQQSVFELSVLNADDFSLLSSDEEMVLVELARSDLLSLLQKTRFCMAVSDARHYLIGTVFDIQDNRLVCATTDGHRLAVNACALEASAGVRAPIVAKKAVEEIIRLYEVLQKQGDEGNAKLWFGYHHMRAHAQFGELSVELVTRLLDGKFPGYERVIPVQNPNIATINAQELEAALKRVLALDSGREMTVSLEFGETLQVRARTNEGASASDVLAVQYQGEPVEVAVNILYLREVITSLGGNFCMHMNAPTSPILFTGENPELRYVVMPIQV